MILCPFCHVALVPCHREEAEEAGERIIAKCPNNPHHVATAKGRLGTNLKGYVIRSLPDSETHEGA